MDKLRIGIFTSCYHPVLNGVVTSIDTFRKELVAQGHKVYIFAPGNIAHQGIDPNGVKRYRCINWPKDYPIALPIIPNIEAKKIHNLRLDIIHCQHIYGFSSSGLKISRILGLPVVLTYHTLITEYAHYVPVIPGSIVKTEIIKRSVDFCNKCDQVVTPSTAMKKVLRSYGVKTAIEVIPTGVDLAKLEKHYNPTILKARWDIPESQKILLYVSRIAKEKNLDFLFEAIKTLAQKRKDFHLLMVGGGPELETYRRYVKKNDLSAIVTFAGMQEKEKANQFFGASDIFVFPSVSETQGIVITEAMAAGIPAVAINEMGPKDLIKDGIDGFLTPLNVEAFCDKIEKLLDSETLRKKMGQKAKIDAKKFSARNSALKMEELYERTINNYNS